MGKLRSFSPVAATTPGYFRQTDSVASGIEMIDIEAGEGGHVNRAFTGDSGSTEHLDVPKTRQGLISRSSSAMAKNGAMKVKQVSDLDETGFQPFRQNVICPNCKNYVTTDIKLVNGRKVWQTFVVLIVIGFCIIVPFFFCYIAFLMEWLKDVVHYCPSCKQKLGRYVRE